MQPSHLAHPRPPCPWCGASSSLVVLSRGDLHRAVYRRRRQCEECGQRWPTIEVLDLARWERELRRQAVPPAVVGLDDRPADQQRVRAWADRWASRVPAAVVEGVVASVGAEITEQEAYDLLAAEQVRLVGRAHVDP